MALDLRQPIDPPDPDIDDRWTISGLVGGNITISQGARLVGTIRRVHRLKMNPTWRVEILWSGPGGDITCTGPRLECIAFVRGVEAMMARLSRQPKQGD